MIQHKSRYTVAHMHTATNTPIPCHSLLLGPSSPLVTRRFPTRVPRKSSNQKDFSTGCWLSRWVEGGIQWFFPSASIQSCKCKQFHTNKEEIFFVFFSRAEKTERRRNISNRAKVFFLNSIGRLLLVSLRCRKKRDLSTWFKSSRNSFKRDPHRRRLMASLFLKNRKRIEGSQVDR